ncbi:MAG TPA: hypothetical protein VM841_12105 [Actinomycetota bacterium]|nr:hypothetical protein [Actinomycetota bacterium]
MSPDGRFDAGMLVQDIVYAGLEALRSAVALDLAAYLHEAPDQGPQLFLGAPTLAEIEPTAAFNLFAALRDGLGEERNGDDIVVPGFCAVAITTSGPVSRGVHVLGRRDAALADYEREVLVRLAYTFAALAHSVEHAPPPDVSPVQAGAWFTPARVVVETVPGGAEATVTVVAGDESRTQTAQASSTPRAVAVAAVAAVDPSLKVVEAGEEQIGDVRAVLALVADATGRQTIGSAVVDEQNDSLRAAAAAALDAAVRLMV